MQMNSEVILENDTEHFSLFYSARKRLSISRATRMYMLDGYLIVNLEPAYIGFSPIIDSRENSWSGRRYCTVEEIRTLLLDLGVIEPDQSWPPRELMLRLKVRIPRTVLEKLELVPMSGMDLAS